MLFLPECCGFLGSSAAETLEAAEDSEHVGQLSLQQETILRDILASPDDDHPTSYTSTTGTVSILAGLQFIAQTSLLWISAGGVHLKAAADGKVTNSHLIWDASGQLCATYHKIHLFDVCIPERNVNLQESKTTVPGTEPVVCRDTPIGKSRSLHHILPSSLTHRIPGDLGVTVCYDLRFPELYTKLVHEMGAQVLLVPSAFTVPTGRAHWHTLLRGRCCVVCSIHQIYYFHLIVFPP